LRFDVSTSWGGFMIRMIQKIVSYFRGRRSHSGNGNSPPQSPLKESSDKDDDADVLKAIADLGGPKRALESRSSRNRRIYDRR
jgi:hypothetical protein